jgi:hypothetical protein
MECAKNRLKRGRHANSFQVQGMDCNGAGLIEGRENDRAVEIVE